MNHKIIVSEPKPLAAVGQRFNLTGRVSKSWLTTATGELDNRLFTNYLDIDGHNFYGGTLFTRPQEILGSSTQLYEFNQIEVFSQFSSSFLQKSKGCITLRISGHDDTTQSIFIPIIVSQFFPSEPVDPMLVEQHLNVGKRIIRLEESLRDYDKELATLLTKEAEEFQADLADDAEGVDVEDMELLDAIEWILNSAESDEKQALDERYSEALAWRGPLLKGVIGQMSGFVFKVHSHDHGQHFHVIHRERGVDARFSFPDINLESYKNKRNFIGTKEIKEIRSFFMEPSNFEKLQQEFEKRTGK